MEYTKFLFVRLATLLVLMSFAITLISAKSKYYDGEDKPYEFGFNIEGEQHRREKKDENGIIMGEFGFITADGVYHVTVYATDENGNFKILSMKNIRLGAAPNKPPPNATPITQFTSSKPPNKQLDEPQADAPAPPPPPPPTTTKKPFSTAKPLPVAACSHCSIPSTTKAPPKEPPQPQQLPQQQYQPPQSQAPQQQAQAPQQQFDLPQLEDRFQGEQPQNQYPQTPSADLTGPFEPSENELPQSDQPNQFNQPQAGLPAAQNEPNQPTPGQYDTPLLISGQVSTADPDAVNQPLRPGEKPGLPNGITTSDMSELLYRFNYTVGFHGHSEKGYSNGAKVGEYYVNYRNGFADRISYVADENGYRPKLETVKLTPEETPNPETEQNEEYGLKGYEFKWFYVPKYHYLNQH